MRLRQAIILLSSSAAPLVFADVQFTSPDAGSSTSAGSTISITWQDSGSGTPLSALSTYQLFLCAGGNDASSYQPLVTITSSGEYTQGNSAAVAINADIGGSDKNAYFFKIVSAMAEGGTVTNFSPRFTLTDMTGSFPAAIEAGVKAAGGSTSGPPTIDNTNGASGAPASNEPAAYTVPYNMQTGATRYAPMQPVPPTKMTINSFSPQYPTSAVTYAQTYLPEPEAQTTITLAQTFSVSSMENTAAPASMPSNDMQKFLNRWKD